MKPLTISDIIRLLEDARDNVGICPDPPYHNKMVEELTNAIDYLNSNDFVLYVP